MRRTEQRAAKGCNANGMICLFSLSTVLHSVEMIEFSSRVGYLDPTFTLYTAADVALFIQKCGLKPKPTLYSHLSTEYTLPDTSDFSSSDFPRPEMLFRRNTLLYIAFCQYGSKCFGLKDYFRN